IEGRSDPLYHFVLLALCSGAIILACLLSVRGQTQIVLPIVQLALPELCMARLLTGFGCPGCGLTRCFVPLAPGGLASAWSYNPAGLWLFAIMAFQIPFRSYQLWRLRRGLPEIALNGALQVVFAIFAIGLIGQWALRLAGVTF